MRHRPAIQRLASGLSLALLLLAGCQRASYSFQPPRVSSADVKVSINAAAPALADTAAAAAPSDLRVVGPATARPVAAGHRHLHWRHVRPAVATPVLKKRHQPAFAPRHPEKTRAARALVAPDEPKPYHKGVAFALAVVLGFLCAHLFYLGRNRGGFRYLLFALACATLCFIAVPVGTSAFVGGGLGGAIVALYILLAGLIGLAYTYLNALADGVRILQGKLTR